MNHSSLKSQLRAKLATIPEGTVLNVAALARELGWHRFSVWWQVDALRRAGLLRRTVERRVGVPIWSDAIRQAVVKGGRKGMPIRQVQQLVEKRFGVTVPRSTIYKMWQCDRSRQC
ncbi:MAG: hypothetical protein AB7G11_02295 [Phycisphaerales bacterium]